jgi:outer membrane protein assembly factor BamE (lipoprotein component of BamABCDE complex)
MLKDRISTWFGAFQRRAARVLVTGLAVISLSACIAEFRNHGYIPSEVQLQDIAVGQDTKETLEASIGVPRASGLLEDSGWYYVRSQFRHYGAYAPKEVSREVLAISFNDAGVVSNVERFGLENGQVVALSRRVTEPNTKGTTFISQLLGGLGNVSAEQLLQ